MGTTLQWHLLPTAEECVTREREVVWTSACSNAHRRPSTCMEHCCALHIHKVYKVTNVSFSSETLLLHTRSICVSFNWRLLAANSHLHRQLNTKFTLTLTFFLILVLLPVAWLRKARGGFLWGRLVVAASDTGRLQWSENTIIAQHDPIKITTPFSLLAHAHSYTAV